MSTQKTELDQLTEQYPVGSRFGKYLITGMLGRGTSAVVLRAVHQTLNIPIAIKFVRPMARDKNPHLYQEFKRESQLLARLNHPHVVRVWDFEDHAERPYIALEYVDGLNLMELLHQAGRIEPVRATEIIEHATKGLAAAWEMGVIHRDVKPGNILLNREGVAKIVDLGLAVLGTDTSPQRGKLVGTAAYMPPEQSLSPSGVDHRADIYSLGCTFYQAVTDTLPFPARNTREAMLKHVTEEAPPPHELVAELPEDISDVIMTMMAKNPDDRYQTAEELLADLDTLKAILRSPSGTAPGAAARPPWPAGRDSHPDTLHAADTTLLRGQSHENLDPEGQVRLAIDAGQAGDLERSMEILTEVAQRHPLNDQAWLWLARFSRTPAQAVGFLQRLLEYQPDHAVARESIKQMRLRAGIAEAGDGNSAAARRFLRPVVEQDARHEQAWLWLARVADTAHQAIDCYHRVLAINPDNTDARTEIRYIGG